LGLATAPGYPVPLEITMEERPNNISKHTSKTRLRKEVNRLSKIADYNECREAAISICLRGDKNETTKNSISFQGILVNNLESLKFFLKKCAKLTSWFKHHNR
jgi:hypothetical protein